MAAGLHSAGAQMTPRVWRWTSIFAVVSIAAWLALGSTAAAPHLRSMHSDPASDAPPMVTVTTDGKLFHRAGCTYIHGPAREESGPQAIAEGYTPCTRCLPRR